MTLKRSTSPQGSGLLYLANKTRDWLALAWVARKYAEQGAPVPFVGSTGWKQREQQLNTATGGANRVLFIPGHGSSPTQRQHGALELPRHSGMGTPGWSSSSDEGTARTNWTWPRKFTLSIWSYNAAEPDEEEAQIHTSDQLLEMVLAAVVVAAKGSVVAGGEIYQDRFSENLPFGLELLVPLVHREPLYALPNDVITDVTPSVSPATT